MSQSTGQDRHPRPHNGEAASLNRRRFLTSGAAAGAVAATAATPTQPARAADAITWDREADVVVIGAGAGGLPAAIAAREKGASVIVLEMNFDIGGRAMMSFGGLYIGGGNRMQQAIGMQDTPDLVFADWARPEMPMGRFRHNRRTGEEDRQRIPMAADAAGNAAHDGGAL